MEVMEQVERYFLEDEKEAVESLFTVQGFSFAGAGQNTGIAFIKPASDWSRARDAGAGRGVRGRAGHEARFRRSATRMVFAFPPPAGAGAGQHRRASTSTCRISAGLGHEALTAARNQFLGMATQKHGVMVNVRPNGQDDTPQFRVDVDEAKASALGLPIAEVNNTLSVAWGGRYIDDFIDRGRVKRVYVQADAPFRMVPEDFLLWSVRNQQGEMVPFATFASTRWTYGSPRLERYNGVPAMEMVGEAAPGVSSGDAMKEVEAMVAQLPAGVGLEWTGQSYQERPGRRADAAALRALAADRLPLPGGDVRELVHPHLGADARAPGDPGHRARRAPARHGARRLLPGGDAHHRRPLQQERDPDRGLREGEPRARAWGSSRARSRAVRARLRPILMTSLAFGLGVLPLALASGRGLGGAARHRHRRPRRHGGGHVPGHLLRAPVLRGGGAPQAAPEAPAPTRPRGLRAGRPRGPWPRVRGMC